jgi:hypothetical protein
MAERQRVRGQRERDERESDEEPERDEPERDERAESDGSARKKSRSRLNAAQAGRQGLEQIAGLTGKEPEGVTGVAKDEDGWVVTVEVVEDRRIPSSTDILATYEAQLDPDGELDSYRRTRRYSRGRGDDGAE